jgi:hypothetical protein
MSTQIQPNQLSPGWEYAHRPITPPRPIQPKKDNRIGRFVQVNFCLSPKERRILAKESKKCRMNMTEFIRMLIIESYGHRFTSRHFRKKGGAP